MNKTVPLKALIRLALITAPLFAIIRIFPLMMFEQITSARNLIGLALVISNTIIFWILNISILYLFGMFRKAPAAWLRYICSIVICVVAAILVFPLFIHLGPMPAPPPGRDMPRAEGFLMPVMQSISINIFILVLIDMVILRNKKDTIENENSKLKIANLEAHHSQLQQQLQPHFLFNSLNVLRALIKKQPKKAEEYVIRLSDLLRYSMHYSRQSMVTLEEELALCTNYLEMQQVRFGKALIYIVDLPEYAIKTKKVPSYSLQLLVENAIKHNRLTIAEPLYIKIMAKDDRTISVINNLQHKSLEGGSSRTGLKNLKERYRILCDEDVIIEETSRDFMVHIKTV